MSNYLKYILACILFILSVYLVFGMHFQGALWVYLSLIVLMIFVSIVGHFSMRWNFHLKAFVGNKNETQKIVAITFDDGPNAVFTPDVLSLLEKFEATATFFCIGQNVIRHPELIKEAAEKGHTIANHSFSHSSTIDFNTTKGWLQEIEKTDAAIEKVLGAAPIIFRPPYGVTTPALARAIKITKHRVVGWNIRPFDTTLKNKKKLVKRITRQIKPGAIILLHDSHDRIPYILEHLLLFLRENNYKTVSINNMMHDAS